MLVVVGKPSRFELMCFKRTRQSILLIPKNASTKIKHYCSTNGGKLYTSVPDNYAVHVPIRNPEDRLWSSIAEYWRMLRRHPSITEQEGKADDLITELFIRRAKSQHTFVNIDEHLQTQAWYVKQVDNPVLFPLENMVEHINENVVNASMQPFDSDVVHRSDLMKTFVEQRLNVVKEELLNFYEEDVKLYRGLI